MKQKPLTLIEGNSEINNDHFYDKVNKIIEEETRKNANICMTCCKKMDSKQEQIQYS